MQLGGHRFSSDAEALRVRAATISAAFCLRPLVLWINRSIDC